MIGKRIPLALMAAVIMALAIGCGQRDNPADPDAIERGFIANYNRSFGENEPPETWLNHRARMIRIYTPPSYPWGAPAGEGTKFPTLYLLNDFDGNEDYSLFSSVNQVADRLIASGEIKPMLIVMADASAQGLGTFYTDGWMMWNPEQAERFEPGNFEKMIWDYLLYFIEEQAWPAERPLNVIRKRASRAIGGVGMGGYGALRIAMNHPDIYSSVSILNGFTSFADMFPAIVDEVFAENGVRKGDKDGYYNHLDTAYSKPFSSLIYSMAAAFSQHDSLSTDDKTLIERYQVDLPFDHNGFIVHPILNKWLANDLTSTMLDSLTSGMYDPLDSTALYIDYSDADQYSGAMQAQSFMSAIDQLGFQYQSSSYSGYPGFPGTHSAFNIERFEEMLKFHSANLSDDPGE
jgi:S-formylglutathione hydrolase FrmB